MQTPPDNPPHMERTTTALIQRMGPPNCPAVIMAANLQALAMQAHGFHIAPPHADLLRRASSEANPFTPRQP